MPKKKKSSSSKKKSTASKKSVSISSSSKKSVNLNDSPTKRKSKIANVVGFADLLPEDWRYYDYVVQTAKSVLRSYEFESASLPLVEDTEIYNRVYGEKSDFVEKSLFSVKDNSRDKKSLRPDFMTGFVRSFVNNSLTKLPQPVKLFSAGPVFNSEVIDDGVVPRQSWQVGAEVFGATSSAIEAQIIQIIWRVMERIGLSDSIVHLNSVGCPECRPDYVQLLIDYYRPNVNKLCAECKKDFKTDPIKLLDCQEEKCQRMAAGAPQMFDNLCDECRDHFKKLLEILDELDIPYLLDSRVVLSANFYRRTVFAITSADVAEKIQNRDILFSGGRHDGLVPLLGGQPTGGIGGALKVDRVVALMKKKEIRLPRLASPKIFLAQLGEKAKKQSFTIFEDLYVAGLDVIESVGRDSLKSQLKQAEKKNVTFTLILGQKEAVDGTMIVRDMDTNVQEVVVQENLIKYLKERLRKKEQNPDVVEEAPDDKKEKSKK